MPSRNSRPRARSRTSRSWGRQDDIDRQLEQLGRSNAVDEDLAKLKAELGKGTKPAPELDPGAPAGETRQ